MLQSEHSQIRFFKIWLLILYSSVIQYENKILLVLSLEIGKPNVQIKNKSTSSNNLLHYGNKMQTFIDLQKWACHCQG